MFIQRTAKSAVSGRLHAHTAIDTGSGFQYQICCKLWYFFRIPRVDQNSLESGYYFSPDRTLHSSFAVGSCPSEVGIWDFRNPSCHTWNNIRFLGPQHFDWKSFGAQNGFLGASKKSPYSVISNDKEGVRFARDHSSLWKRLLSQLPRSTLLIE